jgi:hypothetical protein
MTHHMDLIGKKHDVRITTHRQAKKPNHRISHRRIRDLLATKALIKNQFSKSQCGHIRERERKREGIAKSCLPLIQFLAGLQ